MHGGRVREAEVAARVAASEHEGELSRAAVELAEARAAVDAAREELEQVERSRDDLGAQAGRVAELESERERIREAESAVGATASLRDAAPRRAPNRNGTPPS